MDMNYHYRFAIQNPWKLVRKKKDPLKPYRWTDSGMTFILTVERHKVIEEGWPIWHVSASIYSPITGAPRRLDALPPGAVKGLIDAACLLLVPVGQGETVFNSTELVVHGIRPLSDQERLELRTDYLDAPPLDTLAL